MRSESVVERVDTCGAQPPLSRRFDGLQIVSPRRRLIVATLAGALHVTLCLAPFYFHLIGWLWWAYAIPFVGLSLVPFAWAVGFRVLCRIAHIEGGAPARIALGLQLVAYVMAGVVAGISYAVGMSFIPAATIVLAATVVPGFTAWVAVSDTRWLRRLVG